MDKIRVSDDHPVSIDHTNDQMEHRLYRIMKSHIDDIDVVDAVYSCSIVFQAEISCEVTSGINAVAVDQLPASNLT